MSYSINDLQDLAEILANLDEEELEYIDEVSDELLYELANTKRGRRRLGKYIPSAIMSRSDARRKKELLSRSGEPLYFNRSVRKGGLVRNPKYDDPYRQMWNRSDGIERAVSRLGRGRQSLEDKLKQALAMRGQTSDIETKQRAMKRIRKLSKRLTRNPPRR